jgi:F-type H+-transporting ATPase subunit delta
MKPLLSHDAKSFVAGIVGHLKKGKSSTASVARMETLLKSVTTNARSQGAARVESAVALTQQERQAIASSLEKILGRSVTIEARVVPSLVGGMRITVGDWVVDTTLDYQMKKMAAQII